VGAALAAIVAAKAAPTTILKNYDQLADSYLCGVNKIKNRAINLFLQR